MDKRTPDELSRKEIVARWMGQSKDADKWHLKHTKLKRKHTAMVAEVERMSGMLEQLDKRVTAIEFEHKYQDTDEDYR